MGISSSPTLANLLGWYYEREVNILNHPNIIFYGRYIDDCLAIVYAASEEDALSIVSKVIISSCTIEWNCSSQSQSFLDMLIYKDKDNILQHKPFRKASSHQERIPWISHHPLDVKRGTFIGEMSRLATLSSQVSDYKDSMQGLAALYITHGYPSDLVFHWLKDNITERWTKRLNIAKVDKPEVLILKSKFNTAWNYFNATELGNTILGYWREWIERAEHHNFDEEFPWFDDAIGNVDPRSEHMLLVDEGPVGTFVPDIRKINILNRKMLVSRKRTRNLFDLTNLWKDNVIANMVDDLPSNEVHHKPSSQVDEKLEDLLNQEAFDNLFDPWPQPPEQEIEPVTTYETYWRQFGRSISPERQLEAQLWNRIHGRVDLPTSHGR